MIGKKIPQQAYYLHITGRKSKKCTYPYFIGAVLKRLKNAFTSILSKKAKNSPSPEAIEHLNRALTEYNETNPGYLYINADGQLTKTLSKLPGEFLQNDPLQNVTVSEMVNIVMTYNTNRKP